MSLAHLEPHHSQHNPGLDSLSNLVEFRLFPQVLERILEKGSVQKYASHSKIMVEGGDFDQLFIPLNGQLEIIIKTGRAFDELNLKTIEKGEPIGVWEILDRKRSGFNINCEQAIDIFSCDASDFRQIMQEFPEAKLAFKVLSASSAARSLLQWLLKAKVETQTCIQILKAISPAESRYKKNSVLKVRSAQLFLIQSGHIGISHSDEDKHYVAFLEAGDFFGLSQTLQDSNFHVHPHFISDASLHQIPAEVLREKLPPPVFLKLCSEPRIHRRLETSDESEISSLADAKEVPTQALEALGYKSNIEIAISDGSLRSTCSAAIQNTMRLMDFEVPTHLISSYLVHKESMSLSHFAQVIENFGFITRIVRSDIEDLDQKAFPALSLLQGRPVVLVGVRNGRVFFIEPRTGLMRMKMGRFLKKWNHLHIEIRKSPVHDVTIHEKVDETTYNPAIVGRKIVRFFNTEAKQMLLQMISMNSFQTFVIAAIPTFFMSMLSDILGNKSFHILRMYFLGLVLILAFQMISQWLQKATLNNIDKYFKFNTHSYFYKLTLESPSNFATPLKTGAIVSKFLSIDFLMNSTWKKRIEIPIAAVSFIVYVAIIASFSWQAATVILLFAGLTIAIANIVRNRVGLDELSTASLRQLTIDRWTEYLSGMASIKSAGGEAVFRRITEGVAIDLARGSQIYQISMQKIHGLCSFVFALAPVSAVYICAQAYMNRTLSMEDLMGASIYAGFCTQPLMSIVNLILYSTTSPTLLQMAGTMARVESQRKLTKIESQAALNFKGKIRFDRVSFRYSDRSPLAISDVSFAIEPGQVIAIVGRSGSGKTTLARLISRHLKPQGGKIYYDDVDALEINESLLIDQIGFVTQTPQLFSGTLASNIAYSDDWVDQARVKLAAEAAGAHSFITNLPAGYNYFLSEEGLGLSSGQKQMVAVARTLYQNPRMLILDEATVHLDPKAEKIISDRLLKYLNHRTIVVVVQRISTARKADLILVMKNGRLQEMGSHNQLMHLDGEYAELYRNQVGAES